jgi:hypothetical protein
LSVRAQAAPAGPREVPRSAGGPRRALAAVHHHHAALCCGDRIEGDPHVGLVGAGDDDVVAVVADAAGPRAREILEKPVGDVAGRLAVALDHGDEAEAVAVDSSRHVPAGSIGKRSW